MKYNKKKNTKGSTYYGVYKCKKTGKYYYKNYINKKYIKSNLFNKEIDAAKSYDKFILKNKLKYNKNKKINFPSKQKVFKSIKNNKLNNKLIKKRPKIFEYVKVIIYSRQNDLCTLCNDHLGIGRIIDHIIPRSIGGLDNINNYQAICGTCNKWKTYSFDNFLRNYFKINSLLNVKLEDILIIQKNEYIKFNGPYNIKV